MATKITKSELKQMICEVLHEELASKKYLKESAHNDLTKYRVVLADYEDDDGYDQEDVEFLLKPGQNKGDLVKDLSYNAGFISIYVHDERLATPADIKRLSNDTISDRLPSDPYFNYGDVDEEDWD
jgi:hypothetical protein